MATDIEIEFADTMKLEGHGEMMPMPDADLSMDEDGTIFQHGHEVYFRLEAGRLVDSAGAKQIDLDPGLYLITRRGLFQQLVVYVEPA